MPQTKFVLRKSLELGHQPVVVINKIDRPNARPDEVLDMVFDLFVDLEASDAQLDFPVFYASGKEGYAMRELGQEAKDMTPLFQGILDCVEPPSGDVDGILQFQVATLQYDDYLGRVGVGRVFNGKLNVGDRVAICRRDGTKDNVRITKLWGFQGLERVEATGFEAGDICAVTGLEGVLPGDTITDPETPMPLPTIDIDEPTLSMILMVNNSPFAGQEGKYLTSRQIRDRLDKELEHNVAMKVETTERAEAFIVSGRGELHLSILIEQMRREGFEMQVSQPRVIFRTGPKGEKLEPIEQVVVDVPEEFSGTVIRKLQERRGELTSLTVNFDGTQRLQLQVPARGLIGYRSQFLTDTRGTGVMYTNFHGYEAYRGDILSPRNGALIVQDKGETTGYALFNLQERGTMFVDPGEPVYGGQVIGEHARDNDLVINPTKKKQLTNMRASGSDDSTVLTPPRKMNLEQAIEWIGDDEYVEITPMSVRIRKSELNHSQRKRK